MFRDTNLISWNNSPYLRSWNCFLKNWLFYFTKLSIFYWYKATNISCPPCGGISIESFKRARNRKIEYLSKCVATAPLSKYGSVLYYTEKCNMITKKWEWLGLLLCRKRKKNQKGLPKIPMNWQNVRTNKLLKSHFWNASNFANRSYNLMILYVKLRYVIY